MAAPFRLTRRAFLAASAPLLMGFGGLEAVFAPKARLWERWTAHDPSAKATLDHSAWDRFLARYSVESPDGILRVAYGRVTAEDRAALDAYIDALAGVPVSRLARPEQRAFWINLYNALTIQVILEHYPVETIRDIDISPGLFADGPWDKKLIEIEGERVSLNDIEHRILRPIWKDPRLHYAVNCASLGCPNLQVVAFTAATSDSLLDAGARAYVNHPRGASFENGRLRVSSIYAWFTEDFGDSEAGVIAHLRRYAEPALEAKLARLKTIDDHAYDWRLNDGMGSETAPRSHRPTALNPT